MENSFLSVGVLAVLLGPAYPRCPWLLLPVCGAALLLYFVPDLSASVRLAALGSMGLVVVGYLVTMLSKALEITEG